MAWKKKASSIGMVGPGPLTKFSRTLSAGPLGRLVGPLTITLAALGFVPRDSRYVLTIGEEGTTLVHLRGMKVVDALFVGPDAEDGPETLREYLAGDTRSEVLVVADVLEQIYREDSMPKVSPLDRNKIIERRLNMAFPNEVLRGVRKWPRKRGQAQYVMFAALPASNIIEKWVGFAESLPNPILGVGMVPLEMSELAALLGPSTAGETRRVWRAIVSQEAASGVRQVFAKEGRFIVSRLTQKTARDLTPEAEAMLIEREFRSSISYVKRLGFTDGDRLDLILLADQAVGEVVQARDLPATSVTVMTPFQAGLAVGFGEVGREDSPYADVLLALWMASKKNLQVLLPSPEMRRRLKLAMITRWCAVATLLVTIGSIGYAGSFVSDFIDASTTSDFLQQNMGSLQNDLAEQQRRLKAYPIPIVDLTTVSSADASMTQDQVNPVTVIANLRKALDPSIRIDSFDMETPAPAPAPGSPGGPPANARPTGPRIIYQIDIVVRFVQPNAADPDAVLRQAKDFQTRLTAAFPGLSIDALHLPTPLASETLQVGGAGGATPGRVRPVLPPQPNS